MDLEAMAPMLRRSSARLLHRTERGTALPPVSSDYWEVSESQVTLGTAGPTLLGLQALVDLAEHTDGLWAHIDGESRLSATAARRTRRRLLAHSSPTDCSATQPRGTRFGGGLPAGSGCGSGIGCIDA